MIVNQIKTTIPFNQVKNIYERIEHETLKFTVKWTGTMILEVSNDLNDNEFLNI